MKGDFSRILFDPAKHYAGVLHQQGRVWLDSDWNEDALERLENDQVVARDLVGFSGVPSPGSAFVLSASVNPAVPDDFGISAGHCYVDGMLCRLDQATSYHSQPDFLDAPAIPVPTNGSSLTAIVYLEVWRRLITYLEDPSIREIALGGPDTSTRLKTIVQIKTAVWPNAPVNPTCSQASNFIPTAGQGTLTTLQPAPQPQTLCQLPDPSNYTGRENRLYRVQIHDGGDPSGGGASFQIPLGADAAAGTTSISLVTALTASQIDAATRGGFVTVTDSSGAFERLPLAGVVNNGGTLQLGRPLQQAHTRANSANVTGGVAQFKWSRDNASFATTVSSVAADRVTLTLASLGRDASTAIKQGDLVEISDDASELGPARGHLTYLTAIPDPDTFTVVLLDPLPAAFVVTGGTSNRNMVLRRWDGVGAAAAVYSDAGTPQMNLGNGVRIQFGGALLEPGDYWHFTTRSADGSVQPLLNAPPAGIRRSRASLAIVTWGPPPPTSPPSSPPAGVAMTVVDCRNVFPPLTGFPQTDNGTRITGVVLVDPASGPASPLVNDGNVQITAFGGIDVHCDAAIDPNSIARPTCFLSIEYPVDFSGQGVVTTYFPIKVAGTVTTANGVISWRPLSQTAAMLSQLILSNLSERGILTRLVLKGNFIWTQNDPTSFLDGEVFGAHQSGVNNISLTLPSGDKRRGGDFETWFWLVAAPSFANGITPASAQIYSGESQVFTVSFSSPSPTAGSLTLTSSAPTVATVPATVAIAAGATSATFSAVSIPSTAATGQANITAAFGGQNVVATLTVAPPPVLTGQLQLSATSIVIGGTSVGTITLSGPAPAAGAVVALRTSNAAIANVAASVTIAAHATSGSFAITGVAVGSATITATFGTSLSALITVRPNKAKEVKEIIADTKVLRDNKIREVVKGLETKVSEAIKKIAKSGTPLDAAKIAEMGKSIEGGKVADGASSIGVGALSGTASHTAGLVRSFIRPEERPAVEQAVLDAARED